MEMRRELAEAGDSSLGGESVYGIEAQAAKGSRAHGDGEIPP